jgi:hypothetical protein
VVQDIHMGQIYPVCNYQTLHRKQVLKFHAVCHLILTRYLKALREDEHDSKGVLLIEDVELDHILDKRK